jgi:cytosine/adenosine deaminase-related metal-dependent hydrolase
MMARETRPIETLHVGRLLSEPGGTSVDRDARIAIDGDRIARVEAGVSGGDGGGLIALPALCDLHDHGRGLHHIAFGARDQQFELWRQGLYAHPPVDVYLNAALAFGRLARAGIGSVMHVHSSILVDRLVDDAKAVCRAARDVGIRLAFAVPLRDQQTLGYGEDEDLLARHDPGDRDIIRNTWLYDFPDPARYIDLVRAIAAEVEGPTITVQYGPNSPQACSDALIEAMAEASAADGRRLTAHLLETQTQRQWADAAYPDGFVGHLDRLGLINDRFTGAHGVWLGDADMELMAERGAMISVNTSSNLRLRSGIAPRWTGSSRRAWTSGSGSIRSRSMTTTTRSRKCVSAIGCIPSTNPRRR